MTYTAKLYRRASHCYAWLKTRKEPRYTISFLLYAFALEKNEAWAALMLGPKIWAFLFISITIITLMIP